MSNGSMQTSEEPRLEMSASSNTSDDRIPTMITALSAQVAALSEKFQTPQREVKPNLDLQIKLISTIGPSPNGYPHA